MVASCPAFNVVHLGFCMLSLKCGDMCLSLGSSRLARVDVVDVVCLSGVCDTLWGAAGVRLALRLAYYCCTCLLCTADEVGVDALDGHVAVPHDDSFIEVTDPRCKFVMDETPGLTTEFNAFSAVPTGSAKFELQPTPSFTPTEGLLDEYPDPNIRAANEIIERGLCQSQCKVARSGLTNTAHGDDSDVFPGDLGDILNAPVDDCLLQAMSPPSPVRVSPKKKQRAPPKHMPSPLSQPAPTGSTTALGKRTTGQESDVTPATTEETSRGKRPRSNTGSAPQPSEGHGVQPKVTPRSKTVAAKDFLKRAFTLLAGRPFATEQVVNAALGSSVFPDVPFSQELVDLFHKDSDVQRRYVARQLIGELIDVYIPHFRNKDGKECRGMDPFVRDCLPDLNLECHAKGKALTSAGIKVPDAVLVLVSLHKLNPGLFVLTADMFTA